MLRSKSAGVTPLPSPWRKRGWDAHCMVRFVWLGSNHPHTQGVTAGQGRSAFPYQTLFQKSVQYQEKLRGRVSPKKPLPAPSAFEFGARRRVFDSYF